MGYTVHAVTGKKINRLFKDLGAQNIIDRKEFSGESKLLEKGYGMVLLIRWGKALTKILANKS